MFICGVCVSCVSTNAEGIKENSSNVSTTKKTSQELEYERATKDLVNEVVSIETYENDKKIILQKIQELNVIMKDKRYSAWLNYIDKNSIDYWSQKRNLATASKQLPIKGIQLKSLEDYFKYLFIPSRMGRQIDEIRYISSTSIKAIQVGKQSNDIIVFYNFKKINDEWFVELPIL